MNKKLLPVILVVVFLLSVISGCKNNNRNHQETTSAASTASETSTEPESTTNIEDTINPTSDQEETTVAVSEPAGTTGGTYTPSTPSQKITNAATQNTVQSPAQNTTQYVPQQTKQPATKTPTQPATKKPTQPTTKKPTQPTTPPATGGEVVTYSFPSGMPSPSGITCSVNNQTVKLYNPRVNNNHRWFSDFRPPLSNVPVAMFDFSGTVNVKITLPSTPSNVVVRPVSKGIKATVSGNTISFNISQAGQYSVEYNNSSLNAILVFANPKHTAPTGSNVIYKGPGIHEENIWVMENQTLYLAGGAVIRGKVYCYSNSKIMGRGIIDGSHLDSWKFIGARLPVEMLNANNVQISGISIFDSNAWCAQVQNSSNVTFDNVKIISARPNGDGISMQSSNNVTIKNSFLRTWDDNIVVKNYSAPKSYAINVDNVVLWTDLAQSIEIGYETNKGNNPNPEIYNLNFKNVYVLHNFHKPVISIHNGDNAYIHDITFKNIIVDDAQMGEGDAAGNGFLIDLNNNYNATWSKVTARGSIKNILIEDVNVLSGKSPPSRIDAMQGPITNVTIRNLVIKGTKITNASQGNFFIRDCTVKFE